VTNNSNFYGFQSSTIASAYEDTRAAGLIHFASAGNSAIQLVEYPASLPSVDAITAIDCTGNRASFSSWGPEVAFTGPGEDLFTTDRVGSAGWTTGDYVSGVSGTSFSSPTIAGVAALLLSDAYSLDADEIDACLRASSVDLGASGWDQFYGWGLPKAAAALDCLDLFSDSFESGDTSSWSSSTP
jgi:subtilisin family serine protease